MRRSERGWGAANGWPSLNPSAIAVSHAAKPRRGHWACRAVGSVGRKDRREQTLEGRAQRVGIVPARLESRHRCRDERSCVHAECELETTDRAQLTLSVVTDSVPSPGARRGPRRVAVIAC